MIRSLASIAAGAIASVGAAPHPPAPRQAVVPAIRLPGFAAALAERPLSPGPDAWHPISEGTAWDTIAASRRDTRQDARWRYAVGLIARTRGDDALGVLEVMAGDDPDLHLVPAFRRAQGVALVLLRRPNEALAAFAEDTLIADPESCLWRMRTLAESGQSAPALAQLSCAMPALRARAQAARRPFVLAAGDAALAIGRYRPLLAWLDALPDNDIAANLLRGRAMLATGDVQEGRLRLNRVIYGGNAEQRADAQLAGVEAGIARHTLKSADAIERLDTLRFAWRGGDVEKRVLRLSMTLAIDAGDTRTALASGAVLFRYFNLGADTAPLVAALQQQLATALAPGTAVPLDQGAGLFWDYRDLLPSGIDGDRLVENLVVRLQGAGLYARAADLLLHRLATSAEDIQKGPLSIRIASLDILAGAPDRAVRVLRETDRFPFPPDMQADRRRIEAAALDLLGKPAEALAAIQDIADADGLRAEIYWRARDWTHLVEGGERSLPRPGAMSEVAQAIVLRHAIGLAMLGREDALARLNARYAPAFASLPTGAAFTMLTAQVGAVDPAMLGKAMAALPSASPAGGVGDLIEAGSAAMTRPPGDPQKS